MCYKCALWKSSPQCLLESPVGNIQCQWSKPRTWTHATVYTLLIYLVFIWRHQGCLMYSFLLSVFSCQCLHGAFPNEPHLCWAVSGGGPRAYLRGGRGGWGAKLWPTGKIWDPEAFIPPSYQMVWQTSMGAVDWFITLFNNVLSIHSWMIDCYPLLKCIPVNFPNLLLPRCGTHIFLLHRKKLYNKLKRKKIRKAKRTRETWVVPRSSFN